MFEFQIIHDLRLLLNLSIGFFIAYINALNDFVPVAAYRLHNFNNGSIEDVRIHSN